MSNYRFAHLCCPKCDYTWRETFPSDRGWIRCPDCRQALKGDDYAKCLRGKTDEGYANSRP